MSTISSVLMTLVRQRTAAAAVMLAALAACANPHDPDKRLPGWAVAGGQGFTLVVTGSGFASGARVRWNGADRPTFFIGTSELRATIPTSDLASASTAQVRVFNPAPGGGTAEVRSFVVAAITPPSPAALRAAYREDASRLAVRIVGANAEIELPTALVASLYDALMRVAEFNHPARDSVVDFYQIRTWGNPPLREILVGVDPAAAWVSQWLAGSRLTGNAQVDALMQQHRLELVEYFDRISGHAVLLRAAEPLNTEALSARFRSITGVRHARGSARPGDGNDIRATAIGPAWRLDYSIGWGDCPAGCSERHTWSFEVLPDGPVVYRGSTGRAVPPPNRP